MPRRRKSAIVSVMLRELRIMSRSRGAMIGVLLLASVAWLPAVLLPLRAGQLGLASFNDVLPLALAVEGVLLPLVALLFGADALAGEIEDGSIKAVITLPLSRTAYFTGKLLGRAAALLGAALALFGSAGLLIGLVNGGDGWAGYAGVQGWALLLTAACIAIGAAIAASGRGRVQAYAGALLTWVVLVFVVDAVLLAGIVALTPEVPEQVGEHGHSEMETAMRALPEGSSARLGGLDASAAWMMALDPVDLFRLGGLAGAGSGSGDSGGMPAATIIPVLLGWLVWIGAPFWIGLARFRRLALR